jgi:hypothetical protein
MTAHVQTAPEPTAGRSSIPPIVDVDAHVVEPADVWTSRLPAKYREVGPHVRHLARFGAGGAGAVRPPRRAAHSQDRAGNAIKLFGLSLRA